MDIRDLRWCAVVRHGEYGPGLGLNEVGKRQARVLGERFRELGASDWPGVQIVASPAPRALQTAECIAEALGLAGSRPPRRVDALIHDGDGAALRGFSEWRQGASSLIVVTHQDTAGELIAEFARQRDVRAPSRVLSCGQGIIFPLLEEPGFWAVP